MKIFSTTVLTSAILLGLSSPASAGGGFNHFGFILDSDGAGPRTISSSAAGITTFSSALTDSAGDTSSVFVSSNSSGAGVIEARLHVPIANGVSSSNSCSGSTSTICQPADALADTFTITLGTNTTCTFAIANIEFNYASSALSAAGTSLTTQTQAAEYKLFVFDNSNTISSNAGSCVDGSGKSITSIPTFNSGDAVNIYLNSSKTALMTGSLATPSSGNYGGRH